MSMNNTPSGDSFNPETSGEPTQPIARPQAPAEQAAQQPSVGQPSAGQPAATAPMPPVPPAPAQQHVPGVGAPQAQQYPQYQQFPQHPQAGFGQPAAPKASGKRRMVAPIAVTAVAAAVLASLGTAAVTGQFDGDRASTTTSSSFGSIGQKDDSSVSVPVDSSSSSNPDWQAVTSAVAPSVVAIAVTTPEGSGEGSGVIIDGEGHILTNDHVVSGANDDTVQVTLYDGRIYEAKITGLDPATDLAVVKLVDPPSDLKSAVFADSADVVVGEPVMAVGNPLGLSNTATTGIVSAVNRPVSTATTTADQTAVVTNAIQIDAAINPGNSGGPLFNASGEVIGITSSIASLSSGSSGQSGSIGLGFAIPANLAQNIGSQLIESGSAEHAFLGVSLADGTGTVDGTTRQGAEVKAVTEGSPAEKAGLQVGDVIVAIDGEAVTGAESLTGFVRALPADTEVTLTVVRDGKALDVTATLVTKAEEATSNSDGSGQSGSGQDGSGQSGSGQGGFGSGRGQGGSDSPNNIPDLGQLFPGRQG